MGVVAVLPTIKLQAAFVNKVATVKALFEATSPRIPCNVSDQSPLDSLVAVLLPVLLQ